MQVVVERNTLHSIDVQEAKGSEHDCKVYKDTIGKEISSSIPVDADLGYQGIPAYHANSCIPIKSSKNHQLTKREKAYNKRLSHRRVVIEHVNSKIKTFRCMSYPYRGHYHNRHSLRMALLCGIILASFNPEVNTYLVKSICLSLSGALKDNTIIFPALEIAMSPLRRISSPMIQSKSWFPEIH